jgi:hypothetical protein
MYLMCFPHSYCAQGLGSGWKQTPSADCNVWSTGGKNRRISRRIQRPRYHYLPRGARIRYLFLGWWVNDEASCTVWCVRTCCQHFSHAASRWSQRHPVLGRHLSDWRREVPPSGRRDVCCVQIHRIHGLFEEEYTGWRVLRNDEGPRSTVLRAQHSLLSPG